jgi:hypothetical protein
MATAWRSKPAPSIAAAKAAIKAYTRMYRFLVHPYAPGFRPKSADGAIDGDALLGNAPRAMADLFDLKWLLRKSKPGTMGQNRPAPKVDDLKSAGCVVSPPNPALLCYLLT